MTPQDRELFQQALNALSEIAWSNNSQWQSARARVAITAIRAHIANTKVQEPVAECTDSDKWNCKYCNKTKTCAALTDPRNHGAPIPDGMVLVPEEPTDMESSAMEKESHRIGVPVDSTSLRYIRKAMIAAAKGE